jgi:hypothetical protein
VDEVANNSAPAFKVVCVAPSEADALAVDAAAESFGGSGGHVFTDGSRFAFLWGAADAAVADQIEAALLPVCPGCQVHRLPGPDWRAASGWTGQDISRFMPDPA